MCTLISSEGVIGNFLIEAVKKNDYKIEIKKLYAYDKELSKQLKMHDYYTRFTPEKILAFQENYPFFVTSVDKGFLNIVKRENDEKQYVTLLTRYFRLGLPKFVVEEMEKSSNIVLG